MSERWKDITGWEEVFGVSHSAIQDIKNGKSNKRIIN